MAPFMSPLPKIAVFLLFIYKKLKWLCFVETQFNYKVLTFQYLPVDQWEDRQQDGERKFLPVGIQDTEIRKWTVVACRKSSVHRGECNLKKICCLGIEETVIAT